MDRNLGDPGKPPKLPVRLNAKPTRPHRVRRGELLKRLAPARSLGRRCSASTRTNARRCPMSGRMLV